MVGHSWSGRHVEIIAEILGVRRAEATKTLSSPGIKRIMDEVNNATDLMSEDHARTYRSVCMRINLLTHTVFVSAKYHGAGNGRRVR